MDLNNVVETPSPELSRGTWRKISLGRWAQNPRSLPHIAFLEPTWLCAAWFAGALDFVPRAEEVYLKLRAIKIPQTADEPLVAEYVLDPRTRRYTSLELVPSRKPKHNGGTVTKRCDVLDLGVVYAVARRDEAGTQKLVTAVRQIVMPQVARLTTELAGSFFDDHSSFGIEECE